MTTGITPTTKPCLNIFYEMDVVFCYTKCNTPVNFIS